MTWKRSDIEKLNKSGKIRWFKAGEKVPKKLPAKKSAALIWMQSELSKWAKEHGYYLMKELVFDDNRKFRFDFCFFEIRTAIEYEGGIFLKKSGHNTATHYTKDCAKYNLAVINGWKVLRFTALNYKTVLGTLDALIKLKQ